MSTHDDSLFNRDALLERVTRLPPELFSIVVGWCVGTPTLIAPGDDTLPLMYEPEMRVSDLPQHFKVEYERLLRQRWLRSQKTFYDTTTFIMTHLACLMHRGTFDNISALHASAQQAPRLPRHMRPCPTLILTGLESIELDLPMDVFFSMFNVNVPPFPTPDHAYYDDTSLGAGTYLAHTQKLTLNFTASNPWYDLCSGPWAEEDAEGIRPKDRSNVCTSGLIVDWILTYAWQHNYLQHIQSIELKGDIQASVKKKWYQAFAGTHPEQEDIASQKRIYEIEHHGEPQDIAAGNFWDPIEHYPPKCQCNIPCSRLLHGIVDSDTTSAEELCVTQWEDTAHVEMPPVETQPWYNKTDF